MPRVWVDDIAYSMLKEFCKRNGASIRGIASEAIRKYIKELEENERF